MSLWMIFFSFFLSFVGLFFFVVVVVVVVAVGEYL